jgi:hypothetical protein
MASTLQGTHRKKHDHGNGGPFQEPTSGCQEKYGERWGKMLLCNIWNVVLKLWKQRNEQVHGRQAQDERTTETQQLQHRVRHYYEKLEQLDITDREKIFYKDVKTMLSEDNRYIKAWLKLAQRTFTAAKRDREKFSNERKMMETFFAWKPSDRSRHSTLRRSIQDSRSPDETHPD